VTTRIRLVLIFMCMAATALVNGEEQEAEHTLSRAAALTLQDAFAAMQNDQVEEAERLFKRVLAGNPDHRQARFGYGTLMVKKRDYQSALQILEKLMEEYPDDFMIKNNVAWVLATASDREVRDARRAIVLAQDALLKQPNNYHVWSTLSEANFLIGEYDRAWRAAQEAERISRAMNAPPELTLEYRMQARKCLRASRALSIID